MSNRYLCSFLLCCTAFLLLSDTAQAQLDLQCSQLCTAHSNPEECYPFCLTLGGGTQNPPVSAAEQLGVWLAPHSAVCSAIAKLKERGKTDQQIQQQLTAVSHRQFLLYWKVLRHPGVLWLNLPRPERSSVVEFLRGLTTGCPLTTDQ